MIEVQGYSDKVNDTIDKDEAVIDLNEPDLDKIKRKINVRYTNPDLAEDESDIEDINKMEVRARVKIVKIESIIKKALKKPKYTVKKKKSDNAVKPVEKPKTTDKIKKSDNAVKPVKKPKTTDKMKKSDNAVKPVEKPKTTDKMKKSDNAVTPVKIGRQKKKKRRFRHAENDYLPVFDFSETEKKFDVKIVTLSKQEQLEEIALRKQSYNYRASQYKCEDCGRGFDVDITYNNHRRKHSPMAGPEACSICSLRYNLPCKRYLHEDMHRFKFICQQCGEVSRSRWQAKTHHDLHNGKRFVCKHCDRRFEKRSSCLSHVRLAHPALNVVCDTCGETFVSDNGLKMHKKLTHSEIKQQFKCTTCSASFVSLDALNTHTDLGEHAGRPCEQCGESCASEDALRAHVGERHPSESHFCEECCAVFTSRTAFDVHYRRKHLNERASQAPRVRKPPAHPAPRPRPRGQFMCEQCGYIAQSKAVLSCHQNRHLAVKPFPCPHCPKALPTKEALTWHIRLHTGEKPYKCPECPMTFNLQGNRKRHHRVVHLREHADATPCHICARVFTTKSGMQLHVNSVHNGQPWPRRNRRKRKRVSSSSSSSS